MKINSCLECLKSLYFAVGAFAVLTTAVAIDDANYFYVPVGVHVDDLLIYQPSLRLDEHRWS